MRRVGAVARAGAHVVVVQEAPVVDARRLAELPDASRIRELDLSRNGFTPRGLTHLLHAPWRDGLRSLNLQHNRFSDDGLERLLAEPWPALEHLGLRFVGLTDAGAAFLARHAAERLPALRVLELDFNDISEEGVRALAGAEGIPQG